MKNLKKVIMFNFTYSINYRKIEKQSLTQESEYAQQNPSMWTWEQGGKRNNHVHRHLGGIDVQRQSTSVYRSKFMNLNTIVNFFLW